MRTGARGWKAGFLPGNPANQGPGAQHFHEAVCRSSDFRTHACTVVIDCNGGFFRGRLPGRSSEMRTGSPAIRAAEAGQTACGFGGRVAKRAVEH